MGCELGTDMASDQTECLLLDILYALQPGLAGPGAGREAGLQVRLDPASQ